MFHKDAHALIVCWKCQRYHGAKFQLYNVKKEVTKNGVTTQIKTQDYICKNCKDQNLYAPEKENTSRVLLPRWTKEQIKQMKQMIAESHLAASPQPDPDIILEDKNTKVVVERPSVARTSMATMAI